MSNQPARLREILEQLQGGGLTVDQAVSALRWEPFEDLGFARLDHHRAYRTGVPEVVFCQGKSVDQVLAIFGRLSNRSSLVMGTRVSAEQQVALREQFPHLECYSDARIVALRQGETEPVRGDRYCLVVAAGTADFPVAEEAAVTATLLGNRVERLYDCGVAGLHRLLAARELLEGARVLIVVAGMEGALPSVIGGLVGQPVLAVPTSVGYGANFGGLSALLTMLNSCASGVSVVNIDNGFGAGYLANLILSG